MAEKPYAQVVIGGTFDHMHVGHEALLQKAFTIGEHVTIGLTTDRYVQKVKCQRPIDEEHISGVACPCISIPTIESYAVRKAHLEQWISDNGFINHATIIPIEDMYGVAASETDMFDAIVVSTETKPNADIINDTRKTMGLAPLTIVEVPLVPAADAKPISATRIRQGAIDTKGNLIMPDTLRLELSTPMGSLLVDGNTESVIRGDHDTVTISVGDKTTKRLISNGLIPTLAIIDMQVERQPYVWEQKDLDALCAGHEKRAFVSGPGYISVDAMREISSWAKTRNPMVFVITGEEDLLVLPAILYAPLGAAVYYGQPALQGASRNGPNVGIVRIEVTAETKEKVNALLAQFHGSTMTLDV